MILYTLRASSIEGAPPRLRAKPAAGEIEPPLREMAEITRHECVGPAVHGGVHHEFVSPPEAAGLDQSSGRASGWEDEVWLNQWITAAIA